MRRKATLNEKFKFLEHELKEDTSFYGKKEELEKEYDKTQDDIRKNENLLNFVNKLLDQLNLQDKNTLLYFYVQGLGIAFLENYLYCGRTKAYEQAKRALENFENLLSYS